jgi:low temperature requirement protein LtrA
MIALGESVSGFVAWTMLAGPGLYLAGLALFKFVVRRARPDAPLLGVTALALLTIVATFGSRLALAVCSTAVLLSLAVLAARGQPLIRSS